LPWLAAWAWRSAAVVTVWGAFEPGEFAATADGRTLRFVPKATIVATGAYERPWPIPGWTLPGVMTTGAAQALWRTARRLPGRRVLIAGNGPLNLQLAAELIAAAPKFSPSRRRLPVQACRRSAPCLRWQPPRPGWFSRVCVTSCPSFRRRGDAPPDGCGAGGKDACRPFGSARADAGRRRSQGLRGRRTLPWLWLRAFERIAARARLRA